MCVSSEDEALIAAKAKARKAASRLRADAHKASGDAAAGSMAQTGLEFLGATAPKVVSGFYPYRSEIDLRPLMTRLSGEGWTTCLPIVRQAGAPLDFRAWTPGEPTEPGAWDIPIPLAAAEAVEPDVMLVPLLAFDLAGYRLGYGGGFYDRTIEGFRARKPLITVGIAFAAQEVVEVVRGIHDQPLDWVLTDEGPIRTAKP